MFGITRAATEVLQSIRGYFFKGNTLIPSFYGPTTKSGVRVTEETALRYAVVWACVNNIASDIAKLPSTIIRNDNGSKFIANDHDQYFLLTAQPNQLMSAYTFWKAVGLYQELYGAAFVEIIRNEATGRPIEYRVLCTPLVEDHVVTLGTEKYLFWRDGESGRLISDNDILRFMTWTTDGIDYKSPIQVFRETIGSGIAANNMNAELYNSGLRTDGYIQSNNPTINTEQAKILSGNFSKQLSDWETPVLPGTAEYKEFGMPLTDAQFIENRNFGIADICRIWRMPLHKVNLMENAIKSNLIEQNGEYVQDTLMPRIVNREQEVNRKVFRESERGVFSWDVNTKALLRGDHAARAQMYKTLFETGAITKNEIRANEDMNPLDDGQYGDESHTRLDHIPVSLLMDHFNKQNQIGEA